MVPRVPTLPWDQDSQAGQELPLHVHMVMVQPAVPGQGTTAAGSGPSPYTPAPPSAAG